MMIKQVRLEELSTFAKEVLQEVVKTTQGGATVITLEGELGAGKTTFMQSFAQVLGVEEVVTSPTFVVMRIYETKHNKFNRLVHIDAYRFTDSSESAPLHLNDYFSDPSTIVCIEWPSRLGDQLPLSQHNLSFQVIDDTTREISYVKN